MLLVRCHRPILGLRAICIRVFGDAVFLHSSFFIDRILQNNPVAATSKRAVTGTTSLGNDQTILWRISRLRFGLLFECRSITDFSLPLPWPDVTT